MNTEIFIWLFFFLLLLHLFCLVWFSQKTGSLCVVLSTLELPLRIRLASNSEICLRLSPEGWVSRRVPPLPGWNLHFCVQFRPKHFLHFGGCCDQALPLLFLAVFLPGKWTGCWCRFVCCWFARSGWSLPVQSVGLLCSYRLQTGVLYLLSFAVVFIALIRKSRQFAFRAFIKMCVVLPFILLFCNVWFSPKLCLFVWCSSLI